MHLFIAWGLSTSSSGQCLDRFVFEFLFGEGGNLLECCAIIGGGKKEILRDQFPMVYITLNLLAG